MSHAIIALWERVIAQPVFRRDDALLDQLGAPPVQIGERNACLLTLHSQLFGAPMELLSVCPHCRTTLSFSADGDAMSFQIRANGVPALPQVLECDGHRIEFRLPDTEAVARAQAQTDDEFESWLLDHCVIATSKDGVALNPRALPASVTDALSRRMDELDPGACVSFDLTCPQCENPWVAALDIGEVLWQKVRAAAEGLLLEVDALARSYGWTEREVLGLSPSRRAAYLQLVMA